MLFNSSIFLFYFLPITFFLFFLSKKLSNNLNHFILIIGGFIFYAYWNIYLSPLIIISILFNYYFGNKLIYSFDKSKKIILILSILINILFLSVFKYVDFIILNLNFFFDSNVDYLNLPFPLAMSFFTFQSIAFLVDCYYKTIKETSLSKFSLFIIFFPQLIAGPIVRYNHMMPQFEKDENKIINKQNIILGLTVILIGLFKKVFIADNLSVFVDDIFNNTENIDFYLSWLVSLGFTFQIYFDFSGYVDMATGIALLFNIKLPINFNSPFKSTSIINFWKNWHITLSTFLMNYIYFPLVQYLKNITFFKTMIITFFVFIIAGIWHGPSWQFVIFGGLHGLGLIINHLYKRYIKIKLNSLLSIFLTFNYINFTFIFFRAENLNASLNIIKGMLGINGLNFNQNIQQYYLIFLVLTGAFIICFFFRNVNYLINNFKIKN